MNRDIATLREVVVKLTQMLAGMGLRVTQQGARAYVETDKRTLKPTRVNIPHIPDNASEGLIFAIQGFIDHEVAHILFTDWSVIAKANKHSRQMASLHNIVEDTFIERMMGKKFPGSHFNLKKLYDFFLEHITEKALADPKVTGNPAAEFGVLLVPICRAWSGQQTFKDWLDKNDVWSHPLVDAFVKRLDPKTIAKMATIKNSKEALDVAEEFHAILYPPKPAIPPAAESDEEDESESKSKSKSKSKSDSKDKEPGEGASDAEPSKDDAGEGEGEGKGAKPESDEGEGEEETKPEKPKPSKSEDGEEENAGEEEDEDEKSSKGAGDDGEEDDAGESEKESSADEGDEEEDDGASRSDEGEEEDEGEGSGSGDEEEDEDDDAGSEESEDESEGAGDDGEAPTEDDDSEKSGRVGSEDEPESQKAPGIGAGDELSPFAEHELEPREFDGELEKKISDEAARDARGADYLIFSKDFDVIEPHVISERYKDEWLADLEEKTRHMVGVMQKDIERMMASRSQVVKVPGYRSGKLHTAGLHRLATGDPRVFRRTQENRSASTAVSLLIDNSGSMYGDATKIAMSSAFALSQTLERVGIAHECIGFTTANSYGRRGGRGRHIDGYSTAIISAEASRIGRSFSRIEPLLMPIYKGFNERLTPKVKQRFADVVGAQNFLANNVDGECVENAAWRLSARRETRKVLLVLSDGFPAAIGGSRDLNSHLHEVVDKVSKSGIELVGIGIQSTAVKTFYPRYFVLNDLDSLPRTVMNELRRILNGG